MGGHRKMAQQMMLVILLVSQLPNTLCDTYTSNSLYTPIFTITLLLLLFATRTEEHLEY